MKTEMYYMNDDVKKERGASYVQYSTFEECVEAKGKDGVLTLVNERLLTIVQGKASGIKNKGAGKLKTSKANDWDKLIAVAAAEPQTRALLEKHGVKF